MNYSNHDCRVRTKMPRPAQARKKRVAKTAARVISHGTGNLIGVGAAAAVLLALAPLAAAQVVLQPNEAQSKDAKVYAFLSDMNFQSNLGVVGSGTAHSFKSLLQFDLTAVPIPAGQITLATLELYCTAVTPVNDNNTPPAPIPGSGPGNVSLYQATSAWTETGVTWQTFPSLAPLAVDSEFVAIAGQWYTFDVTNLVRDWQSGAVANNGFAVIMDTSLGQVTLLDSDGLTGASPDPTLAPRLTVVPEPATGLLGLCGMILCAKRRRSARP